jgi:ATP-binding cassette subfamily F protein 3
LLLQNNHILVLDEPTNHLDIPTREKLEEAIMQYDGAIIISSHDEYFLNKIRVDRTINLAKIDEKCF